MSDSQPNAFDDLGLIDINALDDEDGGLDDGLDTTKFPRAAGHVSRAEQVAQEWRTQREAAELDAFDQGGISEATRQKYETGWRDFAGWCEGRNIDPFDAGPDDVRLWILRLKERGIRMSTIEGRISSIRFWFEREGLASPTTTAAVASSLETARRSIGTSQRRAHPLLLDDLVRIVAGLPVTLNRDPDDLRVLRDRALLTIGWAAALRASEICALNIEDITFHGDPDSPDSGGGALVNVRRSKTDQAEAGHSLPVPFSTRRNSCAARAVMALGRKLMAVTQRDSVTGRRLSGQTSTGPLFRGVDRHGNVGARLSRNAVDDIVKLHVRSTLQGDDVTGYSSHSLRAGFVATCDSYGVPEAIVRRTTRHTSSAGLHIYDRPRSAFERSALDADWW